MKVHSSKIIKENKEIDYEECLILGIETTGLKACREWNKKNEWIRSMKNLKKIKEDK